MVLRKLVIDRLSSVMVLMTGKDKSGVNGIGG